MMARLASLVIFLAAWYIASDLAGEQLLPAPITVASTIVAEARSGDLFFNLAVTLTRVFIAFALAMAAGTAIGLLMGRVMLADRLGDPWLIVLLNLPALVIIVLAYVWGGLTEVAAILAVAVNKLPNTVVAIREGARALDRGSTDGTNSACHDVRFAVRRVAAPCLQRPRRDPCRWYGKSSLSSNC